MAIPPAFPREFPAVSLLFPIRSIQYFRCVVAPLREADFKSGRHPVPAPPHGEAAMAIPPAFPVDSLQCCRSSRSVPASFSRCAVAPLREADF